MGDEAVFPGDSLNLRSMTISAPLLLVHVIDFSDLFDGVGLGGRVTDRGRVNELTLFCPRLSVIISIERLHNRKTYIMLPIRSVSAVAK